MEKIFDVWARRNPDWEIRYEDSVVKNFCEYGRGTTNLRDARGKIFGAGYEIFIIAFFIGLYFDQRRKLNPDKNKVKKFGQAIQFWGNIDSVKGRKAYPRIRDYIFAALIAKTDFDFIALDKGDKSVREAVDAIMTTMEEYANWGFHFIEDKLIDNPNYFYTETAFMELFLSFTADVKSMDEDEPESLDDENELQEDEPESIDEEVPVIEPTKTFRKLRTRWTKGEQDELVSFHKLGMTISQLAAHFERPESIIQEQLHKLDLI